MSTVTTLDDTSSLPVAVEYQGKSGKDGTAMQALFKRQMKILQVCKSCKELSTSINQIFSDTVDSCTSYCDLCYTQGNVCESCTSLGHTSVYPQLRACNKCRKNDVKCLKRAMVLVTTDCKEGNKVAMLAMKDELTSGTIDPDLALSSPLPDPPHVGKSMKASFSNWYLKLGSERGNLCILNTLRNRSDQETMATMRQLIPNNDHVRNKDRQDPTAVVTLTNPELTKYLKGLGPVSHTLIPERLRFTEGNKPGMFPNPVSVTIGNYGTILFLCKNEAKCTLFRARLHCPVDKIEKVKEFNFKGIYLTFTQGIALVVSKSTPILIVDMNKIVDIDIEKVRKRDDVIKVLERFSVRFRSSVADMKKAFLTHKTSIKSKY